ncbi:MAG TPA: polysaccharide biosynthesis/export family protein [Planctomycetaceae bacterium]|nr:polysaccharide biosynthesis/export family protein [Planctomycetaceae bacterium]
MSDVPRELEKVSHPTYRVEPPDILLIDAVNNIRPPDAALRPGDGLTIRLANPEPLEPVDPQAHPLEAQLFLELQARFKFINGDYVVQPNGTIDLGPIYGAVSVAGLTTSDAAAAIRTHLTQYARDDMGQPAGILMPQVEVTMPDLAGKQAITGEHLVRPDGTISLGIYGGVYVAGLTLAEVKQAVEEHLSEFVNNPEVNVDVLGYNSKVYYVITDGGGYGETVVRLPCTGNETVLDAIAEINGLSQVSSKRIWIARPSPAGVECAQILDVDYRAIAADGITTTNYQVLPGDRIYIQADQWITFDNVVSKVTAPLERLMGFTILTYGTIRTTAQRPSKTSGGASGFGGFGGGFGGF